MLMSFLTFPYTAYDITGSKFGAALTACTLLVYFAAILLSNEDDQFHGIWGTIAGKKPFDEFIEFNGLIPKNNPKNKDKLYASSVLTILFFILSVIFQEVWMFNITIFLLGAFLNNIASLGYSSPSRNL